MVKKYIAIYMKRNIFLALFCALIVFVPLFISGIVFKPSFYDAVIGSTLPFLLAAVCCRKFNSDCKISQNDIGTGVGVRRKVFGQRCGTSRNDVVFKRFLVDLGGKLRLAQREDKICRL